MSITKELQIKAPSEKQSANLSSLQSTILKEMADEDGFNLHSLLPAAPAGKAKAKPKAKAKSGGNPVIAASKFRTSTIKLFSSMEASARKAFDAAERLLEQTAEAERGQASYKLIQKRFEVLQVLIVEQEATDSNGTSVADLLRKDEYFRELCVQEECIQTLPQMKRLRVLLANN